MTVPLLQLPRTLTVDANGTPRSNAKLYVFAAQTTNPVEVWQDPDLTIPHPSPIRSNTEGTFPPIYADPDMGDLKINITDEDDVQIPGYPIDNIPQVLTTDQVIKEINPESAAEQGAGVTLATQSYGILNPFRYGADGADGAADKSAYQAVLSVLAQPRGIEGWLNDLRVPGYWKSQSELDAAVVPQTYWATPDGTNVLNVMRFMTPAQIADVLSGNGTIDVSGPIQAANDYLEGRANKSIAALGTITPGSAYTNGTYANITLTGGTGTLASANIMVSGGAVTAVTLVDMGNGYAVGDSLSAPAANIGGTGSGFSIPVASLRANGGGKTSMIGGKLFFPGGRYYCGTTGLRIGDMVEWIGNQFSSTRLKWSDAYLGNAITLGPGMAGFNGRDGLYCMGSVIDNIQLELGNLTDWGIWTTGAQQNVTIRNLWITNINRSGGISLQDHWGSTYIKVENVYLIGGAAMASTVVGISCDGPACVELSRVSMNGNSQPLFRGVQYGGGGLKISNFQCEICVTHIDVSASAGENPLVIDSATLNLASSGAQGIWIHSGWTGMIAARGIGVGPFQVAIRNDNTGEAKASQAGSGLMNYFWSGTPTDISVFQNALIVEPVLSINPPSSTILNVESATTFVVTVSNNSAFTMAAPTIGANAMPANGRTGQRILITIRNTSGGSMGTITWDAIFKKPTWTNPGTGNSRSVEFQWNGANWIELWQSAADVPN